MPDDTTSGARFRELTLGGFVDLLGSSEPVPGGGSASAIAAALAASLVAMVAALSEGRPKYAAHATLHRVAGETGRELAGRFLELADEDAAAYAEFAAALKLPRATDAEQSARRAALSAAARAAADVPLAAVDACYELVAAAESLVGRSNANAASDLDVAALLGEAAARGAAANVLVNLPSVDDETYAGEAAAKVMQLLGDVEKLAAAVHEGVPSGQPRGPIPG